MLKKAYRFRLLFLLLMTILTFAAIWLRLYVLQIGRHYYYVKLASAQQTANVSMHPRRGDILDRNGTTLATSGLQDTITIDPRKFVVPDPAMIDALARLVGKPRDVVADWCEQKKVTILTDTATDDFKAAITDLSKTYKLPQNTLVIERKTDVVKLDGRKFSRPQPAMIADLAEIVRKPREVVEGWFKVKRRTIAYRMAPAEVSDAISALAAKYATPNDGIIFEKNSKRHYPNGRFAGHVLGFTAIDDTGDNIGQEGLELKYNDKLKGSTQQDRVKIDANGKKLGPVDESLVEATYGNTIVLTIDEKIQMFAQRALRRRLAQVNAKSGVAVVMDVPTGEILALTNMPDFDPNDFAHATNDERRNSALTDPIEIGSVMKIVTMTLLLDHNLVSTSEMINCEGGTWHVDGRIIRDSHPMEVVPVTEVFAESSNIGMAKLGLRLEPSVFYDGLTRMGLGKPTGLDLSGESGGVLYPLSKWTRLSRTSLPIGYECSLTPIQVVDILGAIGDGGDRLRPCLLKEVRSPAGDVLWRHEPVSLGRVASEESCATVRALMERVVLEGTGEQAAVPGFKIGGKTGTTRKHTAERNYIASFAGLIPIDKPRLAIYVYINEPHSGIFYGGTVAAPVFQDIAMQAAHILNIPPDDPAAFDAAYKLQFRPEGELIDDAADTATIVADASPADPDDPVFESDDASGGDAMGPDVADLPPDPKAVRMPSCLGMTIVRATEAMENAKIEARYQGSGVVARQEPAPGDWLAGGKQALLIFALPSEKNGAGAQADDGQDSAAQSLDARGQAPQPTAPRVFEPR